ncbi:hypothetical protein [Georgenia thermotolerans]|uniref:Uncharacterized protein n=1 Tax=Georgenia thermotolerans TaxID=527326 RepID=A0A7J5ULE6_9MICO|nr:hypothetical protein [Georgenia thermotolerans]KAE8763185.1 hypothetical protein GB883_15470 [Georgenia thermotolerans]
MGRPLRSAAVLAAVIMLATSGCTESAPPELAALDRPAGGTDALPAQIQPPEGLRTFRYVGDSDAAAVYAARGPADRPWCVLLVSAQPEGKISTWPASSACTDDEQFARRGVATSVVGVSGEPAAALLLPDGFSGEVEQGWQIVGANLAVPLAP